MEIVYDMMCVGDTVMLCNAMLDDVSICDCVVLCNYVLRVGLLCIIGCERLLWPRWSNLRTVWRNMFGPGRYGLNEQRYVSLVDRVLAYQVT